MQLLISPTLAREPIKIIAKKSDKYPFLNVRFLCRVQVVRVPDPFIHGPGELLEWVSPCPWKTRETLGILWGRKWQTAAKLDPFLHVIAATRVVKKASKRSYQGQMYITRRDCSAVLGNGGYRTVMCGH